jgi:hypothetical protein
MSLFSYRNISGGFVMKIKIGLLLTSLWLVGCGDETPEMRASLDAYNSEDATVELEENDQSALCLTADSCSQVEFDLTILQNGNVSSDNADASLDGKTLIAQEGINSLWHFKVSSNLELPDNREFRFLVDGEFGVGIDLKEKVFNNFVFNVNSGEKAGNIGIKVQDITYCMMNNDNDRDFCENYATDDQLRTQLIMVPFMVGKKDDMIKALACTAGNIAGAMPGEVGLIANIAKLFIGCEE